MCICVAVINACLVRSPLSTTGCSYGPCMVSKVWCKNYLPTVCERRMGSKHCSVVCTYRHALNGFLDLVNPFQFAPHHHQGHILNLRTRLMNGKCNPFILSCTYVRKCVLLHLWIRYVCTLRLAILIVTAMMLQADRSMWLWLCPLFANSCDRHCVPSLCCG